MTLDRTLMKTLMQFECPHCATLIERTGSWVQHCARPFACPSCGCPVPLGYKEKRAIFDRAAHGISGVVMLVSTRTDLAD